MVAVRFPRSEPRARGFLPVARSGTVRTLRGNIYVCDEVALGTLDLQGISYTRASLPAHQDEVDARGGYV